MDYVAIAVLCLIIFLQSYMIISERKRASQREEDLIVALMAKNIQEYNAAMKSLHETVKDKLKRMKIENDLAIRTQQLMGETGVPVN